MHGAQRETIAVARGQFGSPASRVLEQLRGRGTTAREQLADSTGLSSATVARAVTALVDAGLVRERHDRTPFGRTGRPSVPLEIVTDRHACLGVHLGRWETTIAVGDLVGRVLASRVVPHEDRVPIPVERTARIAAELLDEFLDRRPLAAGVVAPWRDLGLRGDEVAARLREVLGLDVASADHVAAIAAAEFIHRRHGTGGVSCYVYARNAAGFTLAVDKGIQVEISKVADLSHFPTGSDVRCGCGRTGCFEVTVSDHAVGARAHDRGLVAVPSIDAVHAAASRRRSHDDRAAYELLRERAVHLGATAAVVSDMVGPDRMILVGQAFTGYPPLLDLVLDTVRRRSTVGDLALFVTRFGRDIQAVAACTIALGPVYDTPLQTAAR